MPQASFYSSAKWRKTRDEFVRLHKWCAVCKTLGFFTPIHDVDHKIAMAKGGAPFDHKNLEGLCKSHHSQKTVFIDAGLGNKSGKLLVTTGADGFPVRIEQPRSIVRVPKKFT